MSLNFQNWQLIIYGTDGTQIASYNSGIDGSAGIVARVQWNGNYDTMSFTGLPKLLPEMQHGRGIEWRVGGSNPTFETVFTGYMVQVGSSKSDEVAEYRALGHSHRLYRTVNPLRIIYSADVAAMAYQVATAAINQIVPVAVSGTQFDAIGAVGGDYIPRLETFGKTLDALAAMCPAFVVPAGETYQYAGTTFNAGETVPAATWRISERNNVLWFGRPVGTRYMTTALTAQVTLNESDAGTDVTWLPSSSEDAVDIVYARIFDTPSQAVEATVRQRGPQFRQPPNAGAAPMWEDKFPYYPVPLWVTYDSGRDTEFCAEVLVPFKSRRADRGQTQVRTSFHSQIPANPTQDVLLDNDPNTSVKLTEAGYPDYDPSAHFISWDLYNRAIYGVKIEYEISKCTARLVLARKINNPNYLVPRYVYGSIELGAGRDKRATPNRTSIELWLPPHAHETTTARTLIEIGFIQGDAADKYLRVYSMEALEPDYDFARRYASSFAKPPTDDISKIAVNNRFMPLSRQLTLNDTAGAATGHNLASADYVMKNRQILTVFNVGADDTVEVQSARALFAANNSRAINDASRDRGHPQ